MNRPVIGHSSLRAFDRDRVRRIAAGGGPTRRGDELHVECPLCDCALSGDAFTPNRVEEWCEDRACPCHNAGWMPQDELPFGGEA